MVLPQQKRCPEGQTLASESSFVSNANSFEREAPNLKQTAAEAVPLLLESLEVFPQGAHTGAGVTEV